MSRVDVTQDAVLSAVVARLQASMGLNDRQCFEVLFPQEPPPLSPSGDFFVSVAPGPGRFVEGEQVATNVTEDWEVIVTVYTRMRLDDANRDKFLLHDPTRGLFALKRQVLKALAGQDLTDADGNTFLRGWTYAKADPSPDADRRNGIGWWSIHFGISWDWDLVD